MEHDKTQDLKPLGQRQTPGEGGFPSSAPEFFSEQWYYQVSFTTADIYDAVATNINTSLSRECATLLTKYRVARFTTASLCRVECNLVHFLPTKFLVFDLE